MGYSWYWRPNNLLHIYGLEKALTDQVLFGIVPFWWQSQFIWSTTTSFFAISISHTTSKNITLGLSYIMKNKFELIGNNTFSYYFSLISFDPKSKIQSIYQKYIFDNILRTIHDNKCEELLAPLLNKTV